ncbi:MAG: RcnB family protein [Sphingomonas sp.]
MKKFVLAAAVASMVATPVLAAPQHGQPQRSQPQRVVVVHKPAAPAWQAPRYQKPQPQYQARKWQRGQRFDSRYAPRYRQIDYRQHRGMKAPPRGYRYVQSGNDAVLVSIGTGIIAAILINALR